MKHKVLLAVLVFCTAAAVTATAASTERANGFWVGPTALYSTPLSPDELSEHDFDSENFAFGLDARLRMNLLEGSLLAIYDPYKDGEETKFGMIVFPNIGVNLNLAALNLGLSGGPNLWVTEDEEDATKFGVNLKVSADVMIGNIAVGAYYVAVAPDFDSFESEELMGFAGLSVLFKPF